MMATEPNFFAFNLKRLRTAFDMSLATLGTRVGLSPATINTYELKGTMAKGHKLFLFARTFGVLEKDLTDREISNEEALQLFEKTKEKEPVEAPEKSEYSLPADNYSRVEDDQPIPYAKSETELLSGNDIAVGKKIDALFTKHKVKRGEYATDRLNVTPRTLQRIIKGEHKASFETVATIAHDLGESLDYFRVGPLPVGHVLAIMAAQQDTIEALKAQLKS